MTSSNPRATRGRDDAPCGRSAAARRRHVMRVAVHAAAATVLSLGAAVAQAQPFPNKPIKLIIGFPPGGGADAVARPLAELMSKHLGQPVLVDNKPGAGTTIASAAAARAAPDGYTIYLGSAGLHGGLAAMYKDFKYDGKDYTPITRVTIAPLVLAVASDLGVKTVPELIAKAKAEPGKLNYASSGIGGTPHLAGLFFSRLAGVNMVHVPYKGGAQAIQGIVGGETQLTFGTPPSVMPLAKAGRLRAIAVTTAERSALFPELPSIAESGVKGYDFSFWFGLYGPAGLPADVVERLFDAATRALKDPVLIEKLGTTGNAAMPSKSPAEFKTWAEKDGKENLDLIKESGATAS